MVQAEWSCCRRKPTPEVWTALVRAYETNTVPFVGTKTLRAYWNLRYEPGTSVTSFMTELGIGTEELQGFYAQILHVLGEERGKALLSMVLHVDNFAIKTVFMEQLPEKYTFAFCEEKDVDLFLEKVRTAYDEDVIMDGRLGELCNRQQLAFWKQQLGIGTKELQEFYAQIVDPVCSF
ncbi:BQ5605_C021g09252 [Microbotryum silenes-dioicae]|uniref:BQ5605_C021g09252 protein n=1 Tax=Microbotryum silenes-dioicae TaxID=796604 RepID=A0A2X0N606_9BASI|nr:BQ5605_C021g09252 [Microbotryum silenes-dioicae]